ncbi:MAG: hypothetical protein DI539_14800 [Flavobacterium psychrophilum]|nr:MAG: hypothetical protein DI539_14800 [Flavobacterium psychrophilum]
MEYNEDDIDFNNIEWKQFEELCFDLITKFQFHSLKWRQGGADNGRDIEALQTKYNSLVHQFDEKWFFECKKYSSGVAVTDIMEKIAWARAENADHLVIITSSYLTRDARDFIEKSKNTETYRIHTVEGKYLKELLIRFPDIVRKYFIDNYSLLVKNSFQVWLYYDFLPDPEVLVDLCKNVNLKRLNYSEVAFIWLALHQREDEIISYCRYEDITPVEIDFVAPYLIELQNHPYPCLTANEYNKYGLINTLGTATLRSVERDLFYASCNYRLGINDYLQVCFIREAQKLDVRIGYDIKK